MKRYIRTKGGKIIDTFNKEIGVLKKRNHRTKEFRWEYIESEEK